jgi:hypothetical protein
MMLQNPVFAEDETIPINGDFYLLNHQNWNAADKVLCACCRRKE